MGLSEVIIKEVSIKSQCLAGLDANGGPRALGQ